MLDDAVVKAFEEALEAAKLEAENAPAEAEGEEEPAPVL